MKKVVLSIVTAVFIFKSFGQQTNPAAASSKQDYLTKSQKQKTGAWGLLGIGTVMLIGGAYIAGHETFDNDGNDSGVAAAGVVAAMGVAAMIGSIPLFIASGKNKRKAASISFKSERFQYLKNNSLVYKPMPAVSLKINL
jgi:hypothetical protein